MELLNSKLLETTRQERVIISPVIDADLVNRRLVNYKSDWRSYLRADDFMYNY